MSAEEVIYVDKNAFDKKPRELREEYGNRGIPVYYLLPNSRTIVVDVFEFAKSCQGDRWNEKWLRKMSVCCRVNPQSGTSNPDHPIVRIVTADPQYPNPLDERGHTDIDFFLSNLEQTIDNLPWPRELIEIRGWDSSAEDWLDPRETQFAIRTRVPIDQFLKLANGRIEIW